VIHDAKRYYAEIMMPYRKQIQNNLKKLEPYDIQLIAPSHGPLYDKPELIINAYKKWSGDQVYNRVVIPYISMHGSTGYMVEYLVHALVDQGVMVQPFDLAVADIGEVAMSLVDAATIVIGTPTVSGGPHPVVFGATHLVNTLKPKTRFASIIGSYGWGTKAVEQLSALIPNIHAEMLGTVLCKGLPRDPDLALLDDLAVKIARKHQEIGALNDE
jgi:flavorubredoxin